MAEMLGEKGNEYLQEAKSIFEEVQKYKRFNILPFWYMLALCYYLRCQGNTCLPHPFFCLFSFHLFFYIFVCFFLFNLLFHLFFINFCFVLLSQHSFSFEAFIHLQYPSIHPFYYITILSIFHPCV